MLLLQLEFCFQKVNVSSFTISILDSLAGLLNMETGLKIIPCFNGWPARFLGAVLLEGAQAAHNECSSCIRQLFFDCFFSLL